MNLATGLLDVGPYVAGVTLGNMVPIARVWLSGDRGRWDLDFGVVHGPRGWLVCVSSWVVMGGLGACQNIFWHIRALG